AVTTLVDSPEKAEYVLVYKTIRDWLRGDLITHEFAVQESAGPIHQAHLATMNLFRKAAGLVENEDTAWLKLSLSEGPGWIESEYEFKDGELSLVSQVYR